MRPPSFFFSAAVIRFLFPVICDLLPVARSRCPDTLEQAMQHFAHVDYPSAEVGVVLLSEQFKVPGQLDVSFEFGY